MAMKKVEKLNKKRYTTIGIAKLHKALQAPCAAAGG
jgi:hypothetical protein